MAVELITGVGGTDHVGSEDFGEYQASTYGPGRYVLNGCEAEVVDSNTIRIAEGNMLLDGRHARVKGSEDIAIQSGTVGRNRKDLIAIRYTKDKDGIEDSPLAAIVGTPTEGEATVPSYIQGNIRSGDVAVDIPLYEISIEGLAVGEPKLLLETSGDMLALLAGKSDKGHTHAAADVGALPVTGGAMTGNIVLKSTADTDGGAPPSNNFGTFVTMNDVDDNVIGAIQTYHGTDDSVSTRMYARRLVGGQDKINGITAKVNADGSFGYGVSSPDAFRRVISAASTNNNGSIEARGEQLALSGAVGGKSNTLYAQPNCLGYWDGTSGSLIWDVPKIRRGKATVSLSFQGGIGTVYFGETLPNANYILLISGTRDGAYAAVQVRTKMTNGFTFYAFTPHTWQTESITVEWLVMEW